VRVRAAIKGFDPTGKRVADAVAETPDMKLVGAAKTRPRHVARRATEKGYPLYIDEAGKLPELL